MTTLTYDIQKQIKQLSEDGLVRVESTVKRGEIVDYVTIDWTSIQTEQGAHSTAIENLRAAGFAVTDKSYTGKGKYNKGIRFGKCIIN